MFSLLDLPPFFPSSSFLVCPYSIVPYFTFFSLPSSFYLNLSVSFIFFFPSFLSSLYVPFINLSLSFSLPLLLDFLPPLFTSLPPSLLSSLVLLIYPSLSPLLYFLTSYSPQFVYLSFTFPLSFQPLPLSPHSSPSQSG